MVASAESWIVTACARWVSQDGSVLLSVDLIFVICHFLVPKEWTAKIASSPGESVLDREHGLPNRRAMRACHVFPLLT